MTGDGDNVIISPIEKPWPPAPFAPSQSGRWPYARPSPPQPALQGAVPSASASPWRRLFVSAPSWRQAQNRHHHPAPDQTRPALRHRDATHSAFATTESRVCGRTMFFLLARAETNPSGLPFSHSAPRPMPRFPLFPFDSAKRSRSVFPILGKAPPSRCAPTLSPQRLPYSTRRSWFSTAPFCLGGFSTAPGAPPPKTRIWRRAITAVTNFWRNGGDGLMEPCVMGGETVTNSRRTGSKYLFKWHISPFYPHR